MSPQDLRERSCDWLILGPIVGFTTHAQTRILAQPFDRFADRIELRISKAAPGASYDPERGVFLPLQLEGKSWRVPVSSEGPFETKIFDVIGLDPDTRYFYEVVPSDAPKQTAGLFASREVFSFRTLPDVPGSYKFSFHSCNGLHKPPRGGRPTTMWKRLLTAALGDEEVRFAVLGGDQIYADPVREEWQREWEPDFDPSHPAVAGTEEAQRCQAFFDDLPRRYQQIYRAFWRRPEIRTFMGHLPCVATWDDHEIYDGWGSHGNEHLPAQQAFFDAASRTFDAFQAVLAPREPISAGAADYRRGHRAFSFMVGDTAFLVLDLRSQRNVCAQGASCVLGDEQWRWLSAELKHLVQLRVKNVVVVSSVPVVHASEFAERMVPRWNELHDDILDGWGSRPNRADQSRLIGKLFELRNETGANVLILGGDVHVATVGSITSCDRRWCRDGEDEARLHQAVSSAIAYEPPGALAASVVRRLVEGEHRIRGGFVGHIEEMVDARNFSIVEVQSNRAYRFNLFSEHMRGPEQHYLSP